MTPMVQHILQVVVLVTFISVVHAYPDDGFSGEHSSADAGTLWATVCDVASGAYVCYNNTISSNRHHPVCSDVSNEMIQQVSGPLSSEASSRLPSQNDYSDTTYSDNEIEVVGGMLSYPNEFDWNEASSPQRGGLTLIIAGHNAGNRPRASSSVEPRSVQSYLDSIYTPGDRTTYQWDGSTPVSPADIMLDPTLEGLEYRPVQRPALPQQVLEYDPNFLGVPAASDHGLRRVQSNPGSFACRCGRAFGRRCDVRYKQRDS